MIPGDIGVHSKDSHRSPAMDEFGDTLRCVRPALIIVEDVRKLASPEIGSLGTHDDGGNTTTTARRTGVIKANA